MRPVVTALFMMRLIIAALVLMVAVGINFTWVFTVPACLTGGWGTAGDDDKGAFGCWWKTVDKEQARQQAFDEWARESERIDSENRERLNRERRDHRR
jgi:hypothetical protein